MKRYFLLFGLFCVCALVKAQDTTSRFFFDEFHLSLNRTSMRNNNMEDKFGFGFGAYHFFLPNKTINVVLGVEFNRTAFLIKSLSEGHWTRLVDVTYSKNCFSVPVGLRLSVLSSKQFFIEAGGFADFVINSRRQGTGYTADLPVGDYLFETHQYEIDQNAQLSNVFGIYLGLGFQIPVSKFNLIVKPDYKFAVANLPTDNDNLPCRYFRLNIGLKI